MPGAELSHTVHRHFPHVSQDICSAPSSGAGRPTREPAVVVHGAGVGGLTQGLAVVVHEAGARLPTPAVENSYAVHQGKQVTKRSTHARPGMHMQQCSAVLTAMPSTALIQAHCTLGTLIGRVLVAGGRHGFACVPLLTAHDTYKVQAPHP